MQKVITGGWNRHREWLPQQILVSFRFVTVVTLSLSKSWIHKIDDDFKDFCLWCGQVKTTIQGPHVFSLLFPPEKSTASRGPRIRWSQCEDAPLICSSHLPAGQFQRHLCTQRIWKGQVKGLRKLLFSSNRARKPKCLRWKYIGVSKSPFCCSSPLLHFAFPRFWDPPRLSLLGSHGTRSIGSQEQSVNFQLCVGSCLKQLLTQRGRCPNLIFSLEISAWFCVHHSFVSQLGGVDRPQPSQNWHCSSLCKDCKGP